MEHKGNKFASMLRLSPFINGFMNIRFARFKSAIKIIHSGSCIISCTVIANSVLSVLCIHSSSLFASVDFNIYEISEITI